MIDFDDLGANTVKALKAYLTSQNVRPPSHHHHHHTHTHSRTIQTNTHPPTLPIPLGVLPVSSSQG